MAGIHLTLEKLPEVGGHKVRAFEVKKGLRGKICLRKGIAAADIQKKLGLDIVDLDELGIFLGPPKPHINIKVFNNKVNENPGILARMKLRTTPCPEERTMENLFNAFIGFVGKEERVLDSHIIRAAKKYPVCSEQQLALLTSAARETFSGLPGKLRWFIEFAAIEMLPDPAQDRTPLRRKAFKMLGLQFDPAVKGLHHPERLDARTVYRKQAYSDLGLHFDPKLDDIF